MKKENRGGAGRGQGRKKDFACETEIVQIKVPKSKAKELKELFRDIAKKSVLTVLFLILSLTATSESFYELRGYSNKNHFINTYGSAIINDNCEIFIVIGIDTYHIKYNPRVYRDRIDGKIETKATCNNIVCYMALNRGSIEVIELIYQNGENVKFYFK